MKNVVKWFGTVATMVALVVATFGPAYAGVAYSEQNSPYGYNQANPQLTKLQPALRFILNGNPVDSVRSLTFGNSDTSEWVSPWIYQGAAPAPASSSDSTTILYGAYVWTNVSGDSMQATVQYTGVDIGVISTLQTYNVVGSGTLFPIYAWHNRVNSMDPALRVRVILKHNDVTSQVVKTFVPHLYKLGAR